MWVGHSCPTKASELHKSCGSDTLVRLKPWSCTSRVGTAALGCPAEQLSARKTASSRRHRGSQHTKTCAANCPIFSGFKYISLGRAIAIFPGVQGRTQMQLVITFITVVGGLIFSVAVAVVVEEFIFGQIFRMFFTPPKASSRVPILARWIAQPVRANQGR